MNILLLGPPGAGKGTQGALLSRRLDLPRLSTGDLLRDAVARRTPLGLKAQAVMEAGELVSDDLILGVIREELAKPMAANGVIFDGVVRTIPQAEGMDEVLRSLDRQLDHVLLFDVADHHVASRIALRRAAEQRADDEPAAVDIRLAAYRAQTAPLVDWYHARGKLARIDAVGTVEQVEARVCRALSLS
jgi:adenylate kinase